MPLPALRRALVALLVAAPLVAQDSTSRGVRIGLTYDPGTKPGVVVLPVSGARGDSIRAIVQRDLDFGDRVNAIVLDGSVAQDAARATGPNWPLLARLGAAAAVAVTPTPASGARRCIGWPTGWKSPSPVCAASRAPEFSSSADAGSGPSTVTGKV
jgi:hypothetical protein